MTLWSKYIPFKYYYLVKKKDQTNRAGVDPPQTGDARLKTFFLWTPSISLITMNDIEEDNQNQFLLPGFLYIEGIIDHKKQKKKFYSQN